MARQENVVARSFEAGQALATQFIFVVQAADGQVDPVGTAGVRTDGVLLTTATAAGQAVAVQYDGRAQVLSAGTITRGAAVSSNATGRAIAATTGHIIQGYAEEAAVSGQIVTVRLVRGETAA